ncbi:type IV secretion system protein [Bartonella sp. CB178]|uniref:type IV secretion system protein n=1 Tax=Bartonella sp. CB178 TaxID=3112255 RepID=UPI00300E5DE5
MKKLVLSIVMAAILGTPSSVMAWNWGWHASRSTAIDQKKKTLSEPISPQQEIINLIKQHLELNKQQFKQTEGMYKSITANRGIGITKGTGFDSFFLKDPQSIYKNKESSDVFTSVTGILKEENISDSVNDARESINERSRYAAVTDKAISLKVFSDTEKRFQQISKLLEEIDRTQDLKGIAELQARLKAKLAMIQNETTKLQMVAHLRNAERELIGHQKRKRNMKILGSRNREMPAIRSIR